MYSYSERAPQESRKPVILSGVPLGHSTINKAVALCEDAILNGKEHFIVIIESRRLARECLVNSLQLLCAEAAVIGFERLVDWRAIAGKVGDRPTVILYCTAGIMRRPDIERDLGTLADTQGQTQVVVIAEKEDANDILHALDNGASGYISTSIPLTVVIEAIRLVRAGGTYIPGDALRHAQEQRGAHGAKDGRRFNGLLTERQAAVVDALRQGKANKIIAFELNMRESTVKVHVRNIMKKLNARNRTEVAFRIHELLELADQRAEKGGEISKN